MEAPVNEYAPQPKMVREIKTKRVILNNFIVTFNFNCTLIPLLFLCGWIVVLGVTVFINKQPFYRSYCLIFLYKVRSLIPSSAAANLRLPSWRSKDFLMSSSSLSCKDRVSSSSISSAK